MAQPQTPPRELNPYLVLVRFGIRIIILTTFAALGGVNFGRSFVALSAMSAPSQHGNRTSALRTGGTGHSTGD